MNANPVNRIFGLRTGKRPRRLHTIEEDFPLLAQTQKLLALTGVVVIVLAAIDIGVARIGLGHWPDSSGPNSLDDYTSGHFGDPQPAALGFVYQLPHVLWFGLLVATPFSAIITILSTTLVASSKAPLRERITYWVILCVVTHVIIYLPFFIQIPAAISWWAAD